MLNFQGVGQLKTCFFRHSEQLLFHSGYEEETSVEISRAIEAGGMWNILNNPSLHEKATCLKSEPSNLRTKVLKMWGARCLFVHSRCLKQDVENGAKTL